VSCQTNALQVGIAEPAGFRYSVRSRKGGTMLTTIALVAFYLLFPALVIWLGERRLALVDKIGAIIVCYAVGLVIGNLRIIPAGAAGLQDTLSSVMVPLALPLMFFSIDLGKWRKTGGKAILSFLLEVIAVVVVSVAGFFIFRGSIGPEAAKIAGMLNGVYTGGTINLAAIGAALQVDHTMYVAANTSDIVVSAIYLLFMVTVGQRVLGLVLPKFSPQKGGTQDLEVEDYKSYAGMFRRECFVPLLAAFGAAVLIAAVGFSFTLVLPGQWGTITAIVAITTLSIAASFIRPLRRIRLTHQLGQYFILVFCLVIGSTADIMKLAVAAPSVIGYVAVTVFGSLALHVLLAALFRIDTDTVIITSVAGVFSPPFVPMVAAALKNRDVILPGVVTGIIGWVIGTYLGIGISTFLSAVGG
jgi:uncharacterized membrane protein